VLASRFEETNVRHQPRNALVLLLALLAGCKSTAKPESTPDAAVEDARGQADAQPDTSDTKVDAVPDVAREARARDLPEDLPVDESTADAFVPGPVEPLVVNSGNTAKYDLVEGTWKVFSFDTLAGHFYCVGTLDAAVDAYLGSSPSVSPSEYMEKTNYLRALNFTSYSGGKYYIAVAPTGGAASGAFQVADGGDLLELGENTVTLSAPDGGDGMHVYNFSIAPGHTYTISVAGETKQPVTLSLSPVADRSTTGEFDLPFSTRTSVLPIADEPIPLESAVKSTSRLYFFSVRVKEAVTLTLTITLAS
jgi:hypothetical protein